MRYLKIDIKNSCKDTIEKLRPLINDKKIVTISTVVIVLIGIFAGLLIYRAINPTVLKINGISVKTSELKVYINHQKNIFARESMNIENPNESKSLNLTPLDVSHIKNEAVEQITRVKLQTIKAQQLNLTVSSNEYEKLLADTSFPDIYNLPDVTNDNIKKDFALSVKLFNQYIDNSKVEAVEVEQYYNNNNILYIKPDTIKVSEILIKTIDNYGSALSAEEIKAKQDKLSQLKNEIKNPNIDFADLAKRYSEDDDTRDKGGDLGYVSANSTLMKIYQTASSMEIGSISDVIEGLRGYSIIKVFDKKPGSVLSLPQVESNIIKTLKYNKGSDLFYKQLDAWISDAQIEIDQDALDSIEIKIV